MQRGHAEAWLCRVPVVGGDHIFRVFTAALVAATVCLFVYVVASEACPCRIGAAAASPAKLSPAAAAYWLGPLHRCEQPSGWHGGLPRYPGGLGIYAPNWTWAAREIGLLHRYPRGDLAPPIVQARVADYGYRAHRWYWGCFARVGYPPR